MSDRHESDWAEEARMRTAYARRQVGARYGLDQAGQLFMLQDLERRVLRALARHGFLPLRDRNVLEVGCGAGHYLRELIRWGADPGRVVGIDVLEERLAEARRLVPAAIRVENRNAADTGFAKASFDLILQMTVFTSILAVDTRQRVAGEMRRLLAPGGRIVWYDFRVDNPGNRDVRGVGKAEIRRLFPECDIEFQAATLAPPLARALAPRLRPMCAMLNQLPFLRTHYLAVIAPR